MPGHDRYEPIIPRGTDAYRNLKDARYGLCGYTISDNYLDKFVFLL